MLINSTTNVERYIINTVSSHMFSYRYLEASDPDSHGVVDLELVTPLNLASATLKVYFITINSGRVPTPGVF